jgi:enamine deaminase RidA (YjgF/YER057c/UK114 family)
MEKRPVNPWQWHQQYSYSQAVAVNGSTETLFCAGQVSVDSEGAVLNEGDMGAQVQVALANIQEVLTLAGYSWSNLVQLRMYTTDMDALLGAYGEVVKQLENVTPKPAITVVGVTRLAFPELLVEIEATAVK